MIHSSRFTALLDANALYPAPLGDFLLRLAQSDLYKPKWTDEIQEEWICRLLANRQDLKKADLDKTKAAMNTAFPDANVPGYSKLISSLTLPDINDRHILAAAIKCKADVIVTFNLKDFPSTELTEYDIDVQGPDDFIVRLIDLDIEKVNLALANQVNSLKNPPMNREEVLNTLSKCGLKKSAAMLRK